MNLFNYYNDNYYIGVISYSSDKSESCSTTFSLSNIDIDVNHFNEVFPNLSLGNDNQYFDYCRFNDVFSMNAGRDLSIMHLNIRSISRNGDCLISYLSLLNRNFDVICLSETFQRYYYC